MTKLDLQFVVNIALIFTMIGWNVAFWIVKHADVWSKR